MSYGPFASNYRNPLADLGSGLANAQSGASGLFAKFRNNRLVSGTTDFLYSNSLVAKVCFLILVIILFILAVRMGFKTIFWLLSPNKNPILLNGLKDAKKLKIIPQDPNTKDAKPIYRSVNERDGLEFTWSVWLYVDNLVYKQGQKKHVFHKGSSSNIQSATEWKGVNVQGMAFPNNGPGLYIHETKNALIVVMNTFNNVVEEVQIDDIPLNKWINVVLRCKGRDMDTYVNGTIVNRHRFNAVPKQNYGDVYINMNNGFGGLISSLRYFSYALTGVEINNLVNAGPNLTADDSMRIFPPYLSLRWFFSTENPKKT